MGTTLKGGGLNRQTLDAVVSDAKASTQAFADSLKSLGPPPVSESKGKQIFQTLQGQLSDDADAIKSATENVSTPGDVLNAISAVAGTLAKAGTQISDAFDQVKQLDADDKVRQAFSDAPACDSLTGS
jgi:DNA-binding FrmR family transcriptional regulator